MSQTAKNTIVSWGMPDWSRAISISSGYVATDYGWLNWGKYSSGLYAGVCYVNGIAVGECHNTYGDRTGGGNAFVPLSPSDVVTYSDAGWAQFVPMKGV